MRALSARVARIAATDSTVLITGETGTGKELVASAIHSASSRSSKPFLRVNCAAIPDALVESELFGYERGAFTGAQAGHAGWLQEAHQGTIFLDEVGDMSASTQAKLLRVIENKEFRRLGGRAEIHVDVRFIAATNRNLDEMAAEGKFRKDLYFRLNVARVHLLPLRDRKEDIPVLLRHFVHKLSVQNSKQAPEMAGDVWNCLINHEWQGNIRELRNVVEAAFVNSPGDVIRMVDLPENFQKLRRDVPRPLPEEREQLMAALLETKWNKSKAAEQLRWSRMTVYRKMRRYQISTSPDSDDQRLAS